MQSIAIILARGGSKRLHRKNILDFHGKPMLAWTVEAALKSNRFDRVLVSTDDPEIAEIARMYGAEVPFLRNSAYDDQAPSSQATIVAMGQAEVHWKESYDIVTQLMPNCPLRDEHDINAAFLNFLDRKLMSQISCFRYGWMNPWWAAKIDENGAPEYMFPEARLTRSQDLPQLYCPSGAIWIANAKAIKTSGTFYMPGHVLYPLHWISALDIDDAEDLQMATLCFPAKRCP